MSMLYKERFENRVAIENKAYYNEIQNAPILEKALQNNQKQRDLMIISHLRLVVKIARGFRNHNLSISDLVSEGVIGLIEAVDRFDEKKGYNLSSYATLWIKSAINSAILRNKSLVKMGTNASERKLFYNLHKMVDLSDEEVAMKLEVSESHVKTMRMRLSGNDCSLNSKIGEDMEFIENLSCQSKNQEDTLLEKGEKEELASIVKKALSCLNEREKDIIIKRKLNEKTKSLEELANEYNISSERIRQIEKKALLKLKIYIENSKK